MPKYLLQIFYQVFQKARTVECFVIIFRGLLLGSLMVSICVCGIATFQVTQVILSGFSPLGLVTELIVSVST